nr:hypothetical protein [Tanacetum cinerariifolium]
MLHICLRLPHQPFAEPPFEEEIFAFLYFLRHSGAIRRLTDVNINKLHQPWRSFAAIINKYLTRKSSSYDSLRLSQAQILWGLYHKRNVDFAYLMWEDFLYQVEHKDTKKSNEMYYPRFTKVIIHHFMSNDPSIPRRNKVNWHYVRDDHMFITIKLVSRHQNTQQFGALLPIELTNEDIRNSNAYKEYYAVTTGATPHKPKASFRKTRNSSDTTVTPPTTTAGPRLSTFAKGKQPSTTSKASPLRGETRDEESFDPILKTPENTDDEGNGEKNLGMNVGREQGQDEEDEEDELYRDVNINLGRGIQMRDVYTTQEFEDSHVTLTLVNPDGQQQSSSVPSQFVTSMLNPTPDARMECSFETTSQMDVQTPTSVAPFLLSTPTFIPSSIATITTTQQAPTPLTTAPIKVAVQLQSDRLRDEARKENDEFFMTIDENMQKIIKEQVKEQVKSSNSSNTSYVIVVDLSEMELKKILIEKMEGKKSIHQSNEQRNLYRALVEAYESDKIILDTYGDTVTLKRRRDDDADKDEEPSAGSDRGSKRRREGKEPESASAPQEKATRSTGKSKQGFKSQQKLASESATAEEPMQTTFEMEEPSHPEFETGADDQPIIESSQHPKWFSQQKKPPTPDHFSNFLMNWLKVDTLTLELLAGPTYELMKGSCKILNKDKQNKLMRIDELHKFIDGTLTDVRIALDDRLKGVNLLTNASGSQPQGNTKKDRIQRTQSKAKKNKLEDHPRIVRPSLHNKKSVVNTKTISSVPSSKLNVNSNLKCATCTVKFGNDHVAEIMGYGDYKIGNVTISRVYFVEGLGHNLSSVGYFCDSDLEVAFRQHTCFIRNLNGVDLLTGSRGNNLYTLSLKDMMAQRLVRGLPKLKFEKDHLCSACAMGKSKKKSHKPKSKDTNQEKLYLLHMDLYGPIRLESVNGKKYILVIIDDYSQFIWVKCLRSKDEAPDFIIKFLKMIQVRLKVSVRRIRTDNRTKFFNQTLREYYKEVGISHETSFARSP